MRWDDLFADLEAQYDAAAAAELAGEVRDRTRREAALLSLTDRLQSAAGATLSVTLSGTTPVQGVLLDVGPDWLLLREHGAADLLLPIASVLGVTGAGARSDPPGSPGEVSRRLDLAWALRGLARSRVGVQLLLVDGTVLAGTLDRVGADHLDLAEHPAGEARRSGAVRQVRLIPLPAVAAVRSWG